MMDDSPCPGADSSDDQRVTVAMERCAAALDGKADDAESAMVEFFAALGEWAENHEKSPVDAILSRMNEADRAAWSGNTTLARRLNQEALNELDSKADLNNCEFLRARCHQRFAEYHKRDRDFAAAYQSAARAVEIVRPMDWGFILVSYLGQLSKFALLAGRKDEALAAANEALPLVEDRPLHDQTRGQLFLRQAGALLAVGDETSAASAMNHAWECFQAALSRFPGAGVWSDVAEWWEVEASRRAVGQPWPAVREAWEEAIAARRAAVDFWQGNEPGFNSCLADALDQYSAAATAAGDAALGESLQEERQRVAESGGPSPSGAAWT